MIHIVPFDAGALAPQYDEPLPPLGPPPFVASRTEDRRPEQGDGTQAGKTGRLIDQNPKLCLNPRSSPWARAIHDPLRQGRFLVPCDEIRLTTTPPAVTTTARTTQTPGPDGKCEKKVYRSVGIGLAPIREGTIRVDCKEVNDPKPSRCGIG